MILEEMPNKTREELEKYSDVFWSRCTELKNGDRYIERIEKAESIISANLKSAIGCDAKRSKKSLSKLLEDDDFTEDEDKLLLDLLHKFGHGSWELILSKLFMKHRFNWRLLSKTTTDIKRRCDYLLEVYRDNTKVDPRRKKRQGR